MFTFEKNQNPDNRDGKINAIIEKFKVKHDDHFDLPRIEKNLPFNEKLDQLFKHSIFVTSPGGKKYILQTGTRIGVIVNVHGVEIPFYQSSGGTDGKISGTWYPFFGNAGAWLIKGAVEDLQNGYGIKDVKKMMKYLDETLPEYLFTSLLSSEQKKVFSDPTFKNQAGKLKLIQDLHSEFIIDPQEAAEYMAQILGYDLGDAPTDSSDPRNLEFMSNIITNIKNKIGKNKKI